MHGPPWEKQYFKHKRAVNKSAVQGRGRLSGEALQALARQHAEAYATALPFKSIVIDDLLPQPLTFACMRELQAKHNATSFWKTRKTGMGFKRGRGGYPENTEGGVFGPSTARLFDFFQSPRFVAFLETLTGIRDLLIDPKMFGGGPFSITNGGYLSLHTDFNQHLQCSKKNRFHLSTQVPPGCKVATPGWRRINVLLYLNQGWREEWGGSFELWRTDSNYSFLDYHAKVLPQFNRVAIFSVTDISIHGHLDEINHPLKDTRKSLSFYYYTRDIHDEPLITPLLHESIYMPGHAKKRSKFRWTRMVPRYIVR
tara:strand:+ start:922 stop:1857 length:936 start_codon:yes stop_codon:yes gene_type:complete